MENITFQWIVSPACTEGITHAAKRFHCEIATLSGLMKITVYFHDCCLQMITFTCDYINNTRNSHQWLDKNPHATVNTNFHIVFQLMHSVV